MVGAFGLFGVLFLLFCRYLPMIAIAEVKAVMPEADPHGHGAHAHHGGPHDSHAGHGVPSGAMPALRDPRSSEGQP
jgi:molybdopterin-containing oxidoreductase family membrane subunit